MKRKILMYDGNIGEITNIYLSIDENGTLYINDYYACIVLDEIKLYSDGEMGLSGNVEFILDETEKDDYEQLYYQDIRKIEYGDWNPEGTDCEISEDGLCISDNGILTFVCYDWFRGGEHKILDIRKYKKIGDIICGFTYFMEDRKKLDINILKINSSSIYESLEKLFDIVNIDTAEIYHDGDITNEKDWASVKAKAKFLMNKGVNKVEIKFINSGIDKNGKLRNR